ncbi:MAG: polysaccharide deacetylase [Lachnospiraceae bacterium]
MARKEYLTSRRRKAIRRKRITLAILIVLFILLCSALGYFVLNRNKPVNADPDGQETEVDTLEVSTTDTIETTEVAFDYEKELEEANLLAAGYDYDAAIEKIQQIPGYENTQELTDAVASYEETKSTMVKHDVTKVPHIFFHTLIADTDKAFDGDSKQDGYNQVMTTIDEFNKILQEMYDNGYVLVSIRDMAHMEEQEDGSTKMVKGEIWLPEDKKPFVLSQDDVSYYEYMEGDGFASRLVIGDNGKVTNEMDLEDGTTVRGSYDVLPLLEDFIEEHPDFSYRGAKGIIALTGYNGILGYRTSDYTYGPNAQDQSKINPNIEEDKKKAMEVAEAIKAQGWDFASHSWGHIYIKSVGEERFYWDTDMWEAEVEPLIGETDIIIFAFGEDLGTWEGYSGDRYEYLKNKGFNYFCNVDGSKPYWVQINGDYLRQGRMNLDGIRMWQDLTEGKDRLGYLFNVEDVFVSKRPTPVPSM